MNNSSKVIPKDQLNAYVSWQAPEVDGQASSSVEELEIEETDAPVLTAEQIEEIQRQAYQEGFELGKQEGREAGQEEIVQRVKQLDELMQTLNHPFETLDKAVEEDLATLAMAVARQLVRREIKTDPGQIVAVVREAMGVLPTAARNARLYLHPEDAALVREVLALSETEPGWTIVENPVQERGGCRVVSDTSQVDASLETRLNAAIAQVLGGERGSDQ